MIINKIQEFCIHLHHINHLVVYYFYSTTFIPLKTLHSEFQAIEVWFTDQNSQSLEIEDRINRPLVIKQYCHYKNEIFN